METRNLDRIRFVTRHFNDLQGLRYWVPLGLITLSVGGTTYFANRPFVILRAALFLAALLVAFGARRYYRNTFGEVEPQPVYPTRELPSLSIFSPAGPTPRLAGFRQVPPEVRYLLFPLVLAMVLFTTFQATSPSFEIVVDESLIQPPWTTSDSIFVYEPDSSPLALSQSMAKVVGGQMLYALLGACFLGVWLWRERRRSQSYHLVLGVLLLGLSALGSSLGYLLGKEGEIARILNLFLPTVTHLWVALLLCGTAMILAGLLDHWQLIRVQGKPAVETEA
ncbi:MAG: hypothetical protein QOF89_4068 [Acidobacteriota bacterium]|jgi:hypothetical protein|nr:hypothetical protein [Acidobacteriota bacterium]